MAFFEEITVTKFKKHPFEVRKIATSRPEKAPEIRYEIRDETRVWNFHVSKPADLSKLISLLTEASGAL